MALLLHCTLTVKQGEISSHASTEWQENNITTIAVSFFLKAKAK